jgi:L-alanine-DL-glutamate epimerase-like enolase superfamily enzyme
MQITRIRACQPPTPGSPPDWRTQLGQIVVEITTSDGQTGIGVGGGGLAGIHVIETVLRDLLTYRTVFDEIETEAALDAGHSAVKLHVERFGDRPDPAAIAELVARAREKLGPGRPLMIDAFGRWDVESTLQVALAIKPHHVDWLEEPLSCDDLAGYQQLKESAVPIAGGEHEYLLPGFEILAHDQLHSVLQPDINWCGGLTTLVQVYNLARQTGLRVCPHRGSEVYALHAIAALDPAPLAESPRDWFHVLDGAPTIQNGTITLNDAPGFGIQVASSLWKD